MAMAIGEEDEFGDLYADVAMPDVDALSRFGSVFRLYEDESDASAGDHRKTPLHYSEHEELLPGAIIAEGYTDSDEQQGQRAGAPSQSELKDFGSPVDVNDSIDGREHHMEEETEALLIHSITSLAGSPGSEHIASHGISAASNVAHYVSKQDPLEGKDGVRQGLRGGGVSGLEAEDVDTDSDDDLRIVLNPLHHSLQRTASGGIGEDSEDGEDLLILAGNEAADDQEWQEGMFMPVEDIAQGLPVGGEKHGTLGGEKGHSGKGAGVHQGAPRIGYGGHGYHHHYRYVRASALGGGVGATSSAPGLSTRVTSSKGGSGRGDRIGAGRGFMNCRRISLPPWRNSTPRGFLYGLEHSTPSNKTVFDLDIDSLEEKPWRHPHVDVSDYFNFGFDESSWKEYCKQLAQFHLERNMQSKISVYESGRSGQEFDPDLPPELAVAAGLLEASVESICHRTAAINADTARGYQGVGRGYINTYPTLHAIQVGGGGCERRPSADTQARRIRESDAIFLIDVADDDSFKEKSGIDDCQGEEGGDFKTLHGFSPKNQLDLWRKTGVPKKAQLTLDSNAQASGKRSNSVLEGCSAAAGTEIHGRQNVTVFSGGTFTNPPASRRKKPRPSTPLRRMPTQEKRDTDKGQSHSSSLNDGSQLGHEDQVFGTPHRCREENLQLHHSAKVCGGRSLDQDLKVCEGDKFSGNMDIKKGGFSEIISHASKKRRLGLRKANKATRHDNNTAKKSSRTHTLTTGLDANEALVEAENWQQKKHFSGNNGLQHSFDEKSGGVWLCGSSGHIVEKVEGRTNFSPEVEEYKSKVKNTLKLNKVKNQMQGAHSKPAEDQSKEKLKIKKTKKGHKLKDKVKCKDKVHLPGCPNLERRQKDGSGRAMLDWKQGMKDKPKNCFVAEDDYPSWREVESVSTKEKKDQDMGSHKLSERGKWLLQYLESEQKTEDRNTEYKSEGHCNGKDRRTMDRGAEFFSRKKSEDHHPGHERDGQLCEKKGVHSWKALHIIRSKKEEVRHMLLGVRLTSDNTRLFGHSRYETHAKNNMQVAFSDQESMKEKDKRSEVKEREKVCREYLPEVEDQVNCLTTLGGSSVRRHKKHRPKKLQKPSSRRGNQPSTTVLADEQMQESSKSKLVLQNATELTNERNDGSSTLIDGRENDNPDDNYNNKKFDSEGHQSGNYLTKASNSKLSHGFMEPPSGNGYVGFDMDILEENHSAAESLFVKQESLHVTISGSSQDVIEQKGRSKYERWTSHNEQGRDDLCHDATGGMHYGSRITLSSKIPISRVRQCLSQANYSAPEAIEAGDKGIMQSRAGKKGKLARRQNRKTKTGSQQEVVDSSNRWHEQQHVQKPLSKQHLDQLAAKLEKRRERFKLPVVERKEPMLERKEPPQRPAINDSQLANWVEVKPERPARKRSWGGG